MENIISELEDRGFIENITNREENTNHTIVEIKYPK